MGINESDRTGEIVGAAFDIPTIQCCTLPTSSITLPPRRGAQILPPSPQGVSSALIRAGVKSSPILIIPAYKINLETAIDLSLGLTKDTYPLPLDAANKFVSMLIDT